MDDGDEQPGVQHLLLRNLCLRERQVASGFPVVQSNSLRSDSQAEMRK